MATTRTYLDYLDEKIDISPANSQEELDAAELMGSLMEEHGLDVQMQEFDAPSQGKLAHYVLYIVMFVGILLAGFLGTVAGAVGLILVSSIVRVSSSETKASMLIVSLRTAIASMICFLLTPQLRSSIHL